MVKLSYIAGIVLTLTIVLAACADSQNEMRMDAEMASMPTVTPGEITIVNPMSNETPGGAVNGAAYLMILNGTEEAIRLIEVTSDLSEMSSLHESVDDNGVMRMVPQPEGFEIEAGGHLMLEPGGKHIMLEQLHEPLKAGTEFAVTLNFEGADAIEVKIPVMQIGGAAMDHSQMDHDDMADDNE